jgi:hypothetical protein
MQSVRRREEKVAGIMAEFSGYNVFTFLLSKHARQYNMLQQDYKTQGSLVEVSKQS